jgi:hypothetical protein
MPTYSLDPLNPARLVCDDCRQAVTQVDPLTLWATGRMTARQAIEACPDMAEAISRHEFRCPAVRESEDWSALPPALLSAALRLRWERGALAEDQAAQLLAERAPGLPLELYTGAWGRAAVLDGAAYDLAAAWFSGKEQAPMPTAEELACLCPGFETADYTAAIRNNILWARK